MNKLLISTILFFISLSLYGYEINELEYNQLSYAEKEQLSHNKWDEHLKFAELTWKMATEYPYDFNNKDIRKGALFEKIETHKKLIKLSN